MIVKNCFKCEVSHKRTNIINSEGVKNPHILFIGSSPSYMDDKKGTMYNHAAGKLFKRLINKTDLEKYSRFVYTVRCYTGQRNPTETEAHNCASHLIKDLNSHNYKIIVLMGSVAIYSYFGKNKSVKKNAGTFEAINNRIIFYTYSSNYVLNPNSKSITIEFTEHLLKIREILRAYGI